MPYLPIFAEEFFLSSCRFAIEALFILLSSIIVFASKQNVCCAFVYTRISALARDLRFSMWSMHESDHIFCVESFFYRCSRICLLFGLLLDCSIEAPVGNLICWPCMCPSMVSETQRFIIVSLADSRKDSHPVFR